MKFISLIKPFNRVLCKNQIVFIKAVLTHKYSSVATSNSINNTVVNTKYIDFHGVWPEDETIKFKEDMIIHNDFITDNEEQHFITELEPYLKRMRYEFDHWDDAIHGFRETERKNWYPDNKVVINRIRDIAFNGEILPHVHVLDLADNGVIKPHVDSTRYCGSTIAGISLLSDSVMRLVRVDERKYQQSNEEDDYRSQPKVIAGEKKYNFYADIFLKRRSLYIMKNTARYNFTHEILGNDKSHFRNQKIDKNRRISIICRNNP